MTTPTGTITMLDVILELDGVATPREITLNDADVRGLAEVPAGEISMDDLRGKSNQQIVVSGFMTVATIVVGFVDDLIGTNTTNLGSFRDVVYGNVDIGTGVLQSIASTAKLDPLENFDNSTFSNPSFDFGPQVVYLTLKGQGPDRVIVYDEFFYTENVQVQSRRSVPNVTVFTMADVGLEFEFILSTNV